MDASFLCKTVKRTVAGREFALRMDGNALSLAEELTGKNFLDSETWADLKVTTVTALFFACAKQTEQKLTLAQVRAYGPKQMPELVEACRAAWSAANDVPEAEADARPTNGSEQKESAASAE